MSLKPTVQLENVTKIIGKKTIIDNISFDIYPGEVFGFLGPNGAGKTTTIRMLVGLIKPTSGKVEICGFDVRKQFVQAMQRLGSIVENPELYKYLSGRENLQIFARMLPDVDEERIQEVIDLVDLTVRIDDQVRTYSLGMRQRLGIAQALLGRPDVLILDEPTNGLDPMGIKDLRTFIRKLVDDTGLTVLVSSHILSEIELLADRVAIMSHGKIVKVGSVSDLVGALSSGVDWRVSDSFRAFAILKESPYVQAAELYDDHTIHTLMDDSKTSLLNEALMKAGIDVWTIERKVQTLEDLFISLTGGDHIV
ncbi:ABC transporter ATP-binding protein [Cytobacillus oceanisediminis]|uniref:ABC transporter ATP-binding protein n=1 Tax=Cytobacillus oceanisediminis TaxID=665099 RepID=UPI001C248937|nr:ABC transporter ATP-binding protein [Cytobacillus oceanisediminis]MBU8732919.1 ABC transporter ATP-binding protein [Cytobacillus oceanisediminis]